MVYCSNGVTIYGVYKDDNSVDNFDLKPHIFTYEPFNKGSEFDLRDINEEYKIETAGIENYYDQVMKYWSIEAFKSLDHPKVATLEEKPSKAFNASVLAAVKRVYRVQPTKARPWMAVVRCWAVDENFSEILISLTQETITDDLVVVTYTLSSLLAYEALAQNRPTFKERDHVISPVISPIVKLADVCK